MTETPQDLLARLTGFTPGKWVFREAESGPRDDDYNGLFLGDIRTETGNTICCFGNDGLYNNMEGQTPSKADAALIEAAPDLHRELASALAREAALREALLDAAKLAKAHGANLFAHPSMVAWCHQVVAKICAALAVKP